MPKFCIQLWNFIANDQIIWAGAEGSQLIFLSDSLPETNWLVAVLRLVKWVNENSKMCKNGLMDFKKMDM